MKKILSALLVTAIAGTAFAAAPTALAKTTTYKLGDTDKDGVVTVSDVTEIQRVLVERNVSDKEYVKLSGDVNKDGLKIFDATEIQKYLAGFKTPYPIGMFVGAGGGVVENVEVVAEVEGKKEYQKVDNWVIQMFDANGDRNPYYYVATAGSEFKDRAGNSALEVGYMNSRLAYEDENGNPDPSKATIYWEKNTDSVTAPDAIFLAKGTKLDGSDDIAVARDGFIEAYNADKGKYTFDLPLLEETGVTAKVSWDAVGDKDTYSVQLYKDGTAIGDAKTVDGTECTFEGLNEGSYAVVVTPNASGRAVIKEFTVQTEAEGNNDSEEVTRIQTEVKIWVIYCNNCGCWLEGSVFDHLITREDWEKLKNEAATYDSTSINNMGGTDDYHNHTQYYLKGFTTQDLVDVHVNPVEQIGVDSGASYVDQQIKGTGGRNLEKYRPDGDYTIFLKPGEVPVDMTLAEPYKQGSVVEDGQAYAGNSGLIFVNSRTELDDFVQASMNIAKNKSFVGERKYMNTEDVPEGWYYTPVKYAPYISLAFEPYKAEDFIRFSFMDFHRNVQGCNGGYHNEPTRVITGYEKGMTPETYTAKLTVK
ncbi:MAG: dockerin type I repeat-containing protein [Ruminococcus sp.]|nr:dockerin type I repeat-containing protein [Ruminococcus sp.]